MIQSLMPLLCSLNKNLKILANLCLPNKIIKTIPDDPQLDTAAGVKAIRKYETLHPHNISQKASIVLEHFRNVTRYKIGGKAKAMLVTPSRLHAVRYFHEFKNQIELKGYKDLDVLVAFSGEVTDDGNTYTEEKLNVTKDGEHVKENSLPEVFHLHVPVVNFSGTIPPLLCSCGIAFLPDASLNSNWIPDRSR